MSESKRKSWKTWQIWDSVSALALAATTGLVFPDAAEAICIINNDASNVNGTAGNDDIVCDDSAPNPDPDGVDAAAGNDRIGVISGTVLGNILGDRGNDSIIVSGGLVAADIFGGSQADQVSVSGGVVTGIIDAETVSVSGGSVAEISHDLVRQVSITGGTVGLIDTGIGHDRIEIDNASGGLAIGEVRGGDQNDSIFVTSANLSGVTIYGDDGEGVFGISTGFDSIVVTGSTVGAVRAQGFRDTIIITGSTIEDDIHGDSPTSLADGDTIIVSGSSVGGDVHGGTGSDSIHVEASTVSGSVTNAAGGATLPATMDVIDSEIGGDVTNGRGVPLTVSGSTVGGQVVGSGFTDSIAIRNSLVVGGVATEGGDDFLEIRGNANRGEVPASIDGGQGTAVFGDTVSLRFEGTAIINPDAFVNFEHYRVNTGGEDGELRIASGASIDATGGQTSDSSFAVDGGSVTLLDPTSAIVADYIEFGLDTAVQGSGILDGSVVLAGHVEPGNELGELTVEGDLTFRDTAALIIELLDLDTDGEYEPGTEYDLVSATGTVVIESGATVDVQFSQSPAYLLRDTEFTILTGRTISGNFTLGTVPLNMDGLWSIHNTGSAVILSYNGPDQSISEPVSLAGFGLSGLWFLRRRRSFAAKQHPSGRSISSLSSGRHRRLEVPVKADREAGRVPPRHCLPKPDDPVPKHSG